MDYIQQIDEKVVMFRTHDDVVANRGSIKEAARKWWYTSLSHAKRADYAFAVIDDIVRGVYRIQNAHREIDDGFAYPHFDGARLVFDFEDAPEDICAKYNDKLLPEEYRSWGQNPVRYTFK